MSRTPPNDKGPTSKTFSPAKNTPQNAIAGAAFMVAAGTCFALINVAMQYVTMRLGLISTNAAFWQYAFAVAASLPLFLRFGLEPLKTGFPLIHGFRVLAAVIGVQFWVFGLAHVPIWQAIALVMTSPFFVIIEARLFLGEKVGWHRWLATLGGFIGALIILAPWQDDFSLYALAPLGAAFSWSVYSVITKSLTKVESADKITVYLLALLMPVNGVIAFGAGTLAMPGGLALILLIGAGLITALANWFLAKAYSSADASYVQPFDHLKLPLNILAGWLVFHYTPNGNLWIGATLIIIASLYIMRHEAKNGSTQKR